MCFCWKPIRKSWQKLLEKHSQNTEEIRERKVVREVTTKAEDSIESNILRA